MLKAFCFLLGVVPFITGAEVRTGRYTTMASLPSQAQQSPFSEVVSVRFPSSINTIGKAISVLLAPTGYQLATLDNSIAEEVMSQSLPLNLRRFSNVKRFNIITTLVSDSLVFVTDPVHRLIGFDVHPDYAHMAHNFREEISTAQSVETSVDLSDEVPQSESSATAEISKAHTSRSQPVNVSSSQATLAGSTLSSQPQAHVSEIDDEPALFPVFEMQKGDLRTNIKRMAALYDIQNVVFHHSIPLCANWKVTSSYPVPHNNMNDVISYVLSRYKLVPKYYSVDRTLFIRSSQDFKECESE